MLVVPVVTVAWYGHLRDKSARIIVAILVSWLIALGEYCFQVPANRIGYGQFTGYELKIIQECITLAVFTVCAYMYLGEPFAGTTSRPSAASWAR